MADDNGKIVIKPDEILAKHSTWASGEASDASNAGKRREAIGSYAEGCGIENKALSQFRSGLKIKNEGKRKDWLRSLQLLLPVAEAEIFGNEPDMFKQDEAEPNQEDDLEKDQADFDAAADASTVTPLEFGGDAA